MNYDSTLICDVVLIESKWIKLQDCKTVKRNAVRVRVLKKMGFRLFNLKNSPMLSAGEKKPRFYSRSTILYYEDLKRS